MEVSASAGLQSDEARAYFHGTACIDSRCLEDHEAK